MSKNSIQPGHCKISAFFYWINERHSIYLKKTALKKKPWTDDRIFREFKFTNAFRQLDRGTIALTEMLRPHLQGDPSLVFFNIVWYRYFNLDTHATNVGFVRTLEELRAKLQDLWVKNEKIFTSAHMTTGRSGEDKIDTYLDACEYVWERRERLVADVVSDDRLESAFDVMMQLPYCGPFISYEMITDMRWTPLLWDPVDRLTWANPGPGAKRGLRRLGLSETTEAMCELYRLAQHHLDPKKVLPHWTYAQFVSKRNFTEAPVRADKNLLFELREIEHSLCEFDKYQRVFTNTGRPRQKYNGYAED